MHPICQQRLRNQYLSTPANKNAVDVLKSFVAIQAQDYPGAKWALAQRAKGADDELIEQALSDGRILRLHIMRPTWHFVSAEDVRWLLQLTAPRVNAVTSSYYRKAGLDEKVLRRTNNIMTKALSGGRQLTRAELRDAVARTGIEPGDSTRFGHILLRAELDGVICNGARVGNQFTYALLADRAPRSRILQQDEALEEIAFRYFRTRGPATVHDFVWWSGLKVADAKRAIDINGKHLENCSIGDKLFWFSTEKPRTKQRLVTQAHLLPLYDEYFIAYKDRTAGIHPKVSQMKVGTSFVFDAPMVMNGQAVGSWRRVLDKSSVSVKLNPFITLTDSDRNAFNAACENYARFLNKDLGLIL